MGFITATSVVPGERVLLRAEEISWITETDDRCDINDQKGHVWKVTESFDRIAELIPAIFIIATSVVNNERVLLKVEEIDWVCGKRDGCNIYMQNGRTWQVKEVVDEISGLISFAAQGK